MQHVHAQHWIDVGFYLVMLVLFKPMMLHAYGHILCHKYLQTHFLVTSSLKEIRKILIDI